MKTISQPHIPTPTLLAVMGLAFAWLSSAWAADITWNGGGDGINWSVGANWGGTAPGASDRAIFPNQPAGLSTVVNAAYLGTNQFVRIGQSTTTTTNAISLNRDLVLTSNNGTGSGLEYTATISNPNMIHWDINGNYLRFLSTSSDAKVNNLYGTFTLDTANSRIGSSRYPGTGANDTDTFNFGSGANLAVVNVTADSQIGRVTTGTSTADALRLTTINVGSGSEVNISNNSRLDFLQRTRVATANRTTLAVNNSGTINLGAGSTMSVMFQQVNASDVNGIDIRLVNQSGATVNHNGTVLMGLHERGTAYISNAGFWRVGSASVLTGFVASAGSGDSGSVIFTNASTGVITASGATGLLNYNPGNSATFLNQKLTVVNAGAIAPGNGTSGSGLTSVGELEFQDINLQLTSSGVIRLDLGGTSAGLYDTLKLTDGTLNLSASGDTMAVTLVNGFAPAASFSLPVITFTSRTSTFDLLTINGLTDGGTTYFDGAGTYSIQHDTSTIFLNYTLLVIPEPSTVFLFASGAALLWWRRLTRSR